MPNGGGGGQSGTSKPAQPVVTYRHLLSKQTLGPTYVSLLSNDAGDEADRDALYLRIWESTSK